MIVVPHHAPPARRWLAHLVRASEAVDEPRACLENAPAFDPVAVFALARRERVAPLLHLGCGEGRIVDSLPDGFRTACEAVYYRTLRKNLVALETGRSILDAFRRNGIAAAPIDGWAVLQGPFRYHTDPGSRPLEHLELMLREADVERAESVLCELGSARSERRDTGEHGDELYYRQNDAVADLDVELRWGWEGASDCAKRASAPDDQFIDGLCDTTISGYHWPTRIANLFVASQRAARHGLGRWIWLDDIHHLITAAPLDWSELIAAARRWRLRAPLYASLVATRELLRTPIPRDVLRRLAPGPVQRRLLHRSLAACQCEGRASRAARTARLLLGENWWEVARAAARTAKPGSHGQSEWVFPVAAQLRLSRSAQAEAPIGERR